MPLLQPRKIDKGINLRTGIRSLLSLHANDLNTGNDSSTSMKNKAGESEFSITTPPVVCDFFDSPGKDSATRLIHFFVENRDPEAIASLANGLASSGTRLQPPGATADVASTGGPSSLSTLLCPLFLVCLGFTVPKLGVQGRPAGGIDVMAQIPGFNINPTPDKLLGILQDSRFAHFLADATYAPLDQDLFRFRQESGMQSVASLVIASILSKKLAVGVRNAGLEIRVSPGGNFGASIEEAQENAELFNLVAKRLDIRSTCFLTDCSIPYQPYVGRGESLVALHELLYGDPSEWLLEHARQCWRFAAGMTDTPEAPDSVHTVLPEARGVFENHLVSHGSSPSAFFAQVSEVQNQPRTPIKSPKEGFPSYELEEIRGWIVEAQRADGQKRFPDPIGVRLLKRPGDPAVCGEPIFEVRSLSSETLPAAVESLCSIAPEPTSPFRDITI